MTYQEVRQIKKASELPLEYQEELSRMRAELKDENTPFQITLYGSGGRLVFIARRCQHAWEDHGNGNRLPFGGGSYWTISCRPVKWRAVKDLMGPGFSLELCNGKPYGYYGEGADLKRIPVKLKTKAEVISLAREIGKFNI
jgi:hypothetical protein